MNVPNHQHNSGKPPKRRLKPQALRAAKARRQKIGRQPGQGIKSDRLAPKVLRMIEDGNSYRSITGQLGISKSTVTDIAKRHQVLTCR